MPEITLRDALKRAIKEALESDPSVFMMGEDIGEYGGAYAVTDGLLKKFGPDRIKDTPISEQAFVGAGIGAAVAGLRPIVEFMSISFSLVAFDQIVNMAANLRYMSGGQISVPMVIRAPTGAGVQLGATHSQSFETWLAEVPGMKVVCPSNPYDALGLMRSAIKDNNPVFVAEPALLYGEKGEIPDDDYEIEIGKADVTREGSDITLVSYGYGMRPTNEAADKLTERGVSVEVIDLRSLSPFDIDSIVSSVQKTNRVVLIDNARRNGGVMAEVAADLQQCASEWLDGPVMRVGSVDVPWPYSRSLEQEVLMDADDVLVAVAEGYGL
ncbi:MAG: alpha-ketoacid dehydrogenase subunit beta [Dehalococcoidia bacterium]|jgi:pyruvate dehydrogenase E1 component beta subunit|nr:alpha-ketoacid dehydrogenase subunit beta [Chloroflexota bacterium]MDP6055875.1 alpha-ketoacid dehydrogenase subunit beta [Dehalococcoidia bacterium]MDP7091074.1 alpha-ketoacid dehydrogenase subunit beta [Dehalococcoidia bacterium]MDP7261403.1 alpha-ketoacid dehydrogenase subunit beta [Dehalococcoidia bacterium]MDP7484991.1 alpha-ketoacid dehydrogenase subunit beta [Dehalococcoidia bacterium]|tara:strand:+ start:6419 stop:7396 length:978 start_codon:yes stop_codon:yes gene_type:complete